MASIRVETNRRQLVYTYELSQPGEVVITTDAGEVRLVLQGGALEVRTEFGMTLTPRSANVVRIDPVVVD
jgi:hypothetical protein